MANRYRYRFDFDIGHLIKSPCRDCADRHRFPGCMNTCQSLDRIRTVLANSISCTRSFSSTESHAIFLETKDDR